MRFAACTANNVLEGLMKMAGLAHVRVVREVNVLSKLLTANASAFNFVRRRIQYQHSTNILAHHTTPPVAQSNYFFVKD
jgi:hypothetical protein